MEPDGREERGGAAQPEAEARHQAAVQTTATPPPPGARVPDSHGKPVQVVCRIKPREPGDETPGLFSEVTDTSITMPTTYAGDLVKFRFLRVFAPTDPDDAVFAAVAPVVEDVLRGVNGAIVAYGQSGAGKTRTMVGVPGDDRYALPRPPPLVPA